MKSSRVGVILTLLFLAANLAWVRLDKTPPAWDDSYYLANSLAIYDAQTDKGLVGFAQQFLNGMATRPPLISALPTLVYSVVGRTYRAAFAINLLFLACLFAALYSIGSRYATSRAGMLAIWIAGTMPILYGLTRSFLVECGLTALVWIAIALMTGWRESSGVGRALMLGVVCGLGLLMKASFPAYVAIPLVYLVITQRKSVVRPWPMLALVMPIVLLAAPWYAVNFHHAFAFLRFAGSAEIADVYGRGAILSLDAIGAYLYKIADAGHPLYFAALPLLLVATVSSLRPVVRRGLLLCGLWMAPLLFLTFSYYREIRFAAPMFPAVALALSILADQALERWRVKAVVPIAAMLLITSLSMIQTSFGTSPSRSWVSLLVPKPTLSYARRFGHAVGIQETILVDLFRSAKLAGGERSTLLIGSNVLTFNADNFKLAAAQRRLPFDIDTTAYVNDRETLARLLQSADYFIYKEGGGREPSFFNKLGEMAIRIVRESEQFHELPARELSGGGLARTFAHHGSGQLVRRRTFLPAELTDIPDTEVIFNGQLELSGISARLTKASITVRYRWRCIRRMERDFWCFTHLLDAQDKIIGYLDHRLLDGAPPTGLWRAGDTGTEELVLSFQPGMTEVLRLRLGVYHRESGDRLLVSHSKLPLTEGRSAVFLRIPPSVE